MASFVVAYGKYLFGGIQGNLYEMTRNARNDAGVRLRRARRARVISDDNRRLRFKKFEFKMDTGNGLINAPATAPMLAVRWSDNDGRSWSNERQLSLGVAGEYLASIITRNMGSARNRLVEIYMTDNADFTVADAYMVVA